MKTTVTQALRMAIVDANLHDHETLVRDLSGHSIDLVGMTTGRAALAGLRKTAMDVCLIHVQLPDMSGFDLYEMLADVQPMARRLLITDRYSQAEERRALELGAVMYLCKPLQPSWLEQVQRGPQPPLSAPQWPTWRPHTTTQTP